MQSGGHVVEKRQTGKTGVHDPRVHHPWVHHHLGLREGILRGSRGHGRLDLLLLLLPKADGHGLYLPLDWLLGGGLGRPGRGRLHRPLSRPPVLPPGGSQASLPALPLPSVDHHAQAAVFQGLHLRYGVIVPLAPSPLVPYRGVGALAKVHVPVPRARGVLVIRVVLLASQLDSHAVLRALVLVQLVRVEHVHASPEPLGALPGPPGLLPVQHRVLIV